MGRMNKTIGICGLAAMAVLAFAGCAGLGGDDKEVETTLSATVAPDAETVTTTTTESTTAYTIAAITEKETEGADLGHEGSTVINTEPLANSYIISDSDSRYLSKDDLKGLDADELRLARNEIYARHGYIFEDSALLEYFKKQNWYEPTVKKADFKETVLNDYEIKNVNYIKDLENELNGEGKTGSGGGSKDNSEKDKVLKSIEGRWHTGGNSGLIHKTFKGDTMENSQGGINKITGVERFSNSDGVGYKIYIDSGTIYYLFDNDPDFLECHNTSGGYSGADSLVRD